MRSDLSMVWRCRRLTRSRAELSCTLETHRIRQCGAIRAENNSHKFHCASPFDSSHYICYYFIYFFSFYSACKKRSSVLRSSFAAFPLSSLFWFFSGLVFRALLYVNFANARCQKTCCNNGPIMFMSSNEFNEVKFLVFFPPLQWSFVVWRTVSNEWIKINKNELAKIM